MEIKDLMALVNAGFSKDDIAQLMRAAEPRPAEPIPQPEPAPDASRNLYYERLQKESEPAPAPEPVSQIGGAEILAAIKALGDTITGSIHAANLGAAMMHQPPGDTIESVVAQIINPYGDKEV